MDYKTTKTASPDYHTTVNFSSQDEYQAGLECLSWFNVSYTVKKKGIEKTLISDMYGSVRAGEVIAIMGASGAGKSTLLNTLAGRIGPGKLSGDILIDGKPRNPANWRLLCSYVEQDDVMFPNFTVYETLMFAAMLRLPSSMSRAEKMARVETVIGDLGLNGCRDTQIGTPEKKGISGGERKRVSIGIELVADPNLIFLDEPTSGLDSFNALNVISQIRSLATKRRKLVLLTIHQPRTDILDMFDKIIVLAEGRPVWFGPIDSAITHYERLGYHIPPRTNPSDFLLDNTSIDNRSEELKAQSLERIHGFAVAYERIRLQENHGVVPQIQADLQSNKVGWPSSLANEVVTLLRRNMLELSRDRGVLITAIGQTIFMIALVGGVFPGLNYTLVSGMKRQAIAYILPLGLTLGSTMPYVAAFPRYRMIIKRERSAGSYRSASKFFAKFISILPVTVVTTLLVMLGVQFITKLNPNMDRVISFFIILLVNNVTANAFTLAISAVSPSIRMGQIVAPALIFVFLFLSLDLKLQGFTETLKLISPLAYTTNAFLLNEFNDNRITYTSGDHSIPGPVFLMEHIEYKGPSLIVNIVSNLVLTVIFLTIGFVAFNRTSAPLLKLK